MAEESSFSKSVLHASEEIHDFNCSPCLDEGRYNEALKYCVSCKLYYCKKCLGDHNKFPALKGHRMQDVASMKKSTTPPAGTKVGAAPLTEPCDHHPDEVIKMYCGKHEAVCCTVCIALDHRECEGVDYIPKLAKDVRASVAFKEFVDNMETLKEKYKERKEEILEEIQKITNIRDEIIIDIKCFKKELIAKLDELENKSLERVNERCKHLRERMTSTISKVEKFLEQISYTLQEVDNDSEAALFIRMKRASGLEVEKDNIDTATNEFEGLSFSLDKRIQDFLDQTDGLVKAVAPHKIVVKSKHQVTFDSDIYISNIAGMCILNDDTIVMSDSDNEAIKRFSKTFGKIGNIEVKGGPCGICKGYFNDEFVVALYNRHEAHFVKYTDKTMSFKRSFKIGASCRGICLIDNSFFVSCGGGVRDKIPGHIRTFDLSGNMLCTIQTDDSGHRLFARPTHLAPNCDRSKVYVADFDNGVIVLDKTGKTVGQYKHVNLKAAFSVSCSKYGNFVTGLDSGNIQQFDDNNRFIGNILSKNDGLQKPGVLCFFESKNQMILSTEKSKEILLFNI